MACDNCTEFNIPSCLDSLNIDGFFDPLVTYLVVLTNPFGSQTVLELSTNYIGLIQIDIGDDGDVGHDYFFPGKTYTLEVYEDQDDFECNNVGMFLCGYASCINITVVKSTGHDVDHIINCCD